MAKNTETTVNVDPADFRTAYLHVFDSFATDPAAMAEETDFNVKYSRELLAALVNVGIVVISDVNGEEDVWQTLQINMDDTNHEQAEAWIDQWMKDNDIHAIETKPARAKAPDTVKPCYCGCGEKVPGKSFYRPGHDARHAGVIGRLVASTGDKKHYNDLPSDKLVAKATGITERTVAKQDAKRKADHEKADAKAQKAKDKANATTPVAKTEPVAEEGTVRVGKRYGVPATRTGDKVVLADGKAASKSSAASFKPNA